MIQVVRSKIFMTGVAVLLTAGLAAGVAAQGRPGRPGPGGPGGRGMGAGLPLGQLGLTEAQQTQMKDIQQRYREEMRKATQQMFTARETQRKAIETVPLNEGLVRSTSDAVANAETEIAVLQARIHNDVYALLTPEQQAKAKQIQTERAAKMKERRQEMQNGQQKRPRA